jgi:hypothetical protein
LGWFVFLLLDDGKGPYTHLLLADFETDCFFDFALALACRLVVEQTTSDQLIIFGFIGKRRTSKTSNVCLF